MQMDSKCRVQKVFRVGLNCCCKSTVPENYEVSYNVAEDFGTCIHYKHYTNYN